MPVGREEIPALLEGIFTTTPSELMGGLETRDDDEEEEEEEAEGSATGMATFRLEKRREEEEEEGVEVV